MSDWVVKLRNKEVVSSHVTFHEARRAARKCGGGVFRDGELIYRAQGRCQIKVGQKVFVMTVTHYWVGRVIENNSKYLCLDMAAMVVNTGYFSQFMQYEMNKGTEIEPVPTRRVVRISQASICTVHDWGSTIPRKKIEPSESSAD